jgi:hypothetical protein
MSIDLQKHLEWLDRHGVQLSYKNSIRHPYAVDEAAVWARYRAFARDYTTPGQRKALQAELECVWQAIWMTEALAMHEKAIAARNWEHVDWTWRQLKAACQAYDRKVTRCSYPRIAGTLQKRWKAAKKGGRKPIKTLDDLCSDYDRRIADGTPRSTVIARLARNSNVTKRTMNRLLRPAGRGAATQKIPHEKNPGTKP